MYDFDMRALLDTFNGDSEALANAFADALNKELADQRKKNHMQEAAQEVADAWECFVDEYYEVHELPKGATCETFYVDSEDVIALMQIIEKVLPYFGMIDLYAEKLNNISNNIIDGAKRYKKEVENNAFEDVMKKFFKENNL